MAAPAEALAETLTAWGLLTPGRARHLLEDEADDVVLGPYQLLDRLGAREPFALKADYTKRGQVVVLKLLASEDLPHVAEAVTRLDHPNLVAVYDACAVEGGVHFLVLEYVEGPSLADLLERHGPLPVPLACEAVRQAALALQHAHAKGMVHGNLTPAKLLLAGWSGPDDEPRVKVLDFGRARPAHAGPVTVAAEPPPVLAGLRAWTDWASPEQIQDRQRVDTRSDLYALGCILYHALTGRVPFAGDTAGERLSARWRREPEPVRRLRPDVPEELAAVVHRLLARNPRDRFQTPSALAAALASLGRPAGPETPAAGPGPAEPPVKAEREDGWLAAPSPAAAPGLSAGPSSRRPRKRASWKRRLRRWLGAAAAVAAVGALFHFVFTSEGGPRDLIRRAWSAVDYRLGDHGPLAVGVGLGLLVIYGIVRSARRA